MTRPQATPSIAPDQEGLLNDSDFLREALRRFLQQFLHAELYERTERRQGYRNGYKPRQLTTRAGRHELALPPRSGRPFPVRALRAVSTLGESAGVGPAAVVSARSVDARGQSRHGKLCGTHFSESLVSSVCQALDTDIEAWLNRPLTQTVSVSGDRCPL